jgi:hypothetical protein
MAGVRQRAQLQEVGEDPAKAHGAFGVSRWVVIVGRWLRVSLTHIRLRADQMVTTLTTSDITTAIVRIWP